MIYAVPSRRVWNDFGALRHGLHCVATISFVLDFTVTISTLTGNLLKHWQLLRTEVPVAGDVHASENVQSTNFV